MQTSDDPNRVQGIPPTLLRCARWLRWELKKNARGKPTKVPDRSTATAATDRIEDLDVARGADHGIGFNLRGGVDVPGERDLARLFALDIDGCRDPESGALEPWAMAIWTWSGRSYAEVTPSGTGIRVWIKTATFPPTFASAKVRVPHPAPHGVTKKPELQVFGYGPPSYVTVTGDALPGAAPDILEVSDLRWLIDEYGLQEAAEDVADGQLPSGAPGTEAPSLDTIAATVDSAGVAALVNEADHLKRPGEPDASSAFFEVCREVLRAAHGHGRAALDYILERTAWGLGRVEESLDPSKYSRPGWVARDLRRAAAKLGESTHTPVFEPVTEGDLQQLGDVDAGNLDVVKGAASDFDLRWPEGGVDIDTTPAARKFLLRLTDGTPAAPLGEVCILSAEGGCGKTTAVVQLAVAVATGGRWLNYFETDPASNASKVLLLLGEEDAEECQRKIYNACSNLELDAVQRQQVRDNVTAVPLASAIVPLLEPAEHGAVVASVHARRLQARLEEGGPWGLVVIDPMSRFAGVNVESDNILATRFIQELEILARAPGTPMVLVLAHSSKESRRAKDADARGVTGLTDGARWHATMKRETSGNVTFAVPKTNYTPPIDSVGLVRGEHGTLTAEDSAARLARRAAEAENDPATIRERREEEKLERLVRDVVTRAATQPGLTKRQLAGAVTGQTALIMRAVDRAVARGLMVVVREGIRDLHHVPGWLK